MPVSVEHCSNYRVEIANETVNIQGGLRFTMIRMETFVELSILSQLIFEKAVRVSVYSIRTYIPRMNIRIYSSAQFPSWKGHELMATSFA